MQVTITFLLILLNRTDTPTTGGLETIFDEEKTWLFWSWDADTVLIVSVTWSMFSTIRTHTDLTVLEKGFCSTRSKLVVLTWASFATLRRVLSLVALFIPSMGLCSILHHWKWEQVPFEFRHKIAQKVRPDDKISLFGLKKTILWTELDRWNYMAEIPSPPNYNFYTLLTLQETFIALICLSILQFIAIFVVKRCISLDFRKEEHTTNKVLHTLENLNFASPFRDWDDGDYSIQQFKERATAVRKEMIWTQAINFLATILMMVPLWYTGTYKMAWILIPYSSFPEYYYLFQIIRFELVTTSWRYSWVKSRKRKHSLWKLPAPW